MEYNFGAWGEPKGRMHYAAYADLVMLNPFRYRGYVYDEEMGLYYLHLYRGEKLK